MNSVLIYVLIVTAIAGVGGTGLGGLISTLFKKNSTKAVSLLLSFAGGVMLSVVFLDLMTEGIKEANDAHLNGSLLMIFGVIIGFAVISLLNYVIDKHTNKEVEHSNEEKHPKTADDLDELIHADHYEEHKKSNNNLFVAGLIMASAIALHNLPEGMVIGAAYTDIQSVSNLFTSSGMLVAIVLGLHNIPEGMAVAVPLIAGGMPKWKAVLMTALSGFPTVIGALIGYLLGTMGALWNVLALGFASGAMLYVVFGELLPESILMWKSKLPSCAVIIGILLGVFIIF